MKNSIYLSLVVVLVLVLCSAHAFQNGWDIPEKYKTMKNPYSGVADDDEIGADLWSEHCASCHGKMGAGDGNKAGELDAEMEDFSEELVQNQTDGILYYKSFIGKDEMPNFEKKITDEEERWMLVNYIRELAE